MEIKDALELAQENYKDYSLYVAQGRSFPNIKDGLKSVAKRSIYGMYKDGPRTKVKLAKLASYALPYHPHPTSIGGAITQLGDAGNIVKLIDTQGNWGDSSQGIKASAERYIEGRLSDLAIELCCDSVEYTNYIKGEIDEDEPEALPTYLPICFINGVEGIPSGLPKINIPTLNINDMISYYQAKLKKKNIDFIPRNLPALYTNCTLLSSKEEWEQILKTGKGTIKLGPKMTLNDNTITITALPSGRSIDTIYKLLEKEILGDKIDVRDESTTSLTIVIEKVKNKSCDMNSIFELLQNKLQANISYNMAFFDNNYIYVPCSFETVVKNNLQYVIDTHTNRIEHELIDTQRKLKVLKIIESMKSSPNCLNKLFSLSFNDAVTYIITTYATDENIAKAVLQKPISYLTKEHLKEIEEYKNIISNLINDKNDIYEFLSKKYNCIKSSLNRYLQEKNS